MPPRANKSPARTPRAKSPARVPTTDRVTRGSATPDAKAAVEAAFKAATADPDDDIEDGASDSAFKRSVLIYLGCVSALCAAIAAVVYAAPPSPGGVCNSVDSNLLYALLPKPVPDSAAIVTVWKCATEYQKANWWFILFFFELCFVGLKMFALPVAFALSIIGGALFPFPFSQAVVSVGETFGSTLCYLLSGAIAKPILDRFAAEKLASLRKRAVEERDNMLLFNVFLRLSPAPNWFVNLASPIVGNPIGKFALGTFAGTFFPLMLLGRVGNVLRTVGETGFDVAAITKSNFPYMVFVGSSQFLPLYLIRRNKRLKAEAKKAKAASKAE